MKKIFILLALVFLITGCSIEKMPQDNLEKVIDSVLTNKVKLRNQNFSGYKYYKPREVSLINKFGYNITLLHKGNEMFFYVDVISYYHKVDKDYNLKNDIYLSKELEYGSKKGYINIEEKELVDKSFIVDNYINKNTSFMVDSLKLNGIKVMTLGTGNKIINQYPSNGSVITSDDLVILLTNEYTNNIPNLVGRSFKEVITVLDFLDIDYEYEGYGYLESQSIEGELLQADEVVKLVFKPKY
jgi:hypothetical protein